MHRLFDLFVGLFQLIRQPFVLGSQGGDLPGQALTLFDHFLQLGTGLFPQFRLLIGLFGKGGYQIQIGRGVTIQHFVKAL